MTNRTLDDLNPESAPVLQNMGNTFTRLQSNAKDFRILPDHCRLVTSVRGNHESFLLRIRFFSGMPLGVAWLEALLLRLNPDLQKIMQRKDC